MDTLRTRALDVLALLSDLPDGDVARVLDYAQRLLEQQPVDSSTGIEALVEESA